MATVARRQLIPQLCLAAAGFGAHYNVGRPYLLTCFRAVRGMDNKKKEGRGKGRVEKGRKEDWP